MIDTFDLKRMLKEFIHYSLQQYNAYFKNMRYIYLFIYTIYGRENECSIINSSTVNNYWRGLICDKQLPLDEDTVTCWLCYISCAIQCIVQYTYNVNFSSIHYTDNLKYNNQVFAVKLTKIFLAIWIQKLETFYHLRVLNPHLTPDTVGDCASAPLPVLLEYESYRIYRINQYCRTLNMLLHVLYTYKKIPSTATFTTNTTGSDSSNSRQEEAINRANITGRQSIRATMTDTMSTLNNYSDDDGNDKPPNRGLQLKSRCARDNEIPHLEKDKTKLSFIQMAKDLLGLSRSSSVYTSDKTETPNNETQYEDSLDTHLLLELPDGSSAHANKFTGEVFYDRSTECSKQKMNSTECTQTPSKEKHQPNITFTLIAETYEVKTPNVSNEAATSFTPVLRANYDEIMNSTASSAIISRHTNKIPDIIVTPIQETYEQGSLLELPTSPPAKAAECLIQSENNLPGSTEFLTPPPKTRSRLRKPVGDLPRSVDSTLLSTRERSRLAHSPLRRSSPQRLRRLSIRMSGVHKTGTHGNHKLHYKSNFTIMHNLPASTTTLKKAQRLSSMNAQILDYRCDLMDVKPPGLGGNTISDLLSSSLVRSSNPIKKMFTEVNKYRINATTAKEFMNTVGIHCLKGKMERTNLRALMDDVNCEPVLAIVNTGSNLKMIVTPNRPAPFVLDGFDIELCTGTMIMVEPKLLTDYKFMDPSQGSKDDEICLLFFHKDEATWVKEEPQGRDESISLVSKGTLQTSSTISKLSPEEKTTNEKVGTGESADYGDKHEDTAGNYSEITSDTDTKCSVGHCWRSPTQNITKM